MSSTTNDQLTIINPFIDIHQFIDSFIMTPPKQLPTITANIQHIKPDLETVSSIFANAVKGVECDDYTQDYKATYDFDDNDACYVNHRQKNNNTDDDGNDIDLNENEYTNGALSRSAKGVYGKHDANSGHNGCTDDDEDFDSEQEIVCEENEPSPFFQEDDEVDKCDDQSSEDGDWADENGTDYYIDDDCW